ncbi:3-methylitaconate isomerase [bacterium MnTg02]|nr:3-methylitaconate isomerase [bacterium MnTg02]
MALDQIKIPAVFMRGGTSNAVVFKQSDLPADRALWDEIFLAAIGSPDPNGRQLDGMGGGISSLSKVCVIGPPSREDADIDYTFAQVAVKDAVVDYSSNCGNMSSAMGPFAVDEGLVQVSGDSAYVRIHNTNTGKIIHSRFPLDGGRAAVDGDMVLQGVAGTGAPVRLEFEDPGGASTDRLLPTGRPVDRIEADGFGAIDVSLVDATNACLFVRAGDIGLTGTEMSDEIDADSALMDRLEELRCRVSVTMGIASSLDDAAAKPSIPKIGIVTGPQQAPTLSGANLAADGMDLLARMISLGNCHRALPLTGALCLTVAARIPGTVVHDVTRPPEDYSEDLHIAQPSGLTISCATVTRSGEAWFADRACVYRTARRIFEGNILVPSSRVTEVIAAEHSAAAE